MLALIAERIPPAAWLVTYNGRGFDWPLLVTRFRMARRDAPPHAGHLDLLPLVRRLFRHRMADARLRTAEAELLGLRRVGDVDGWQIPGRYLDFLRGGPADPLVEVVRHNDQDVRSLAHLVGHVERGYADPEARSAAPRGDLAGLARAFARERRFDEALECLEAAVAAEDEQPPSPTPAAADPVSGGGARDGGRLVAARLPAGLRRTSEAAGAIAGLRPAGSLRRALVGGAAVPGPCPRPSPAGPHRGRRRGVGGPRRVAGEDSGSSRRSSSRSSASTASAIRSGRSRRPPAGWSRPSAGGGSGGRSRSSRRTSYVGSIRLRKRLEGRRRRLGSAERQTAGPPHASSRRLRPCAVGRHPGPARPPARAPRRGATPPQPPAAGRSAGRSARRPGPASRGPRGPPPGTRRPLPSDPPRRRAAAKGTDTGDAGHPARPPLRVRPGRRSSPGAWHRDATTRRPRRCGCPARSPCR